MKVSTPNDVTSPARAPRLREGRGALELRPVSLRTNVNRHAEGSALIEWGDTHVLATVSVVQGLPRHMRHGGRGGGNSSGWLTAEYALLPRATHERTPRERLYSSGRTQEIQRLIGRALRAATDLRLFQNRTVTVDVDVLQADGGTRCAGIVAGWAALHDMADRLVRAGTLDEWPLRAEIAAVSVGLVGDEPRVDLEYSEDVEASADLNVVATGEGRIVEVQGGSEDVPIDAERYVQLVASGVAAAQRLVTLVKQSLP